MQYALSRISAEALYSLIAGAGGSQGYHRQAITFRGIWLVSRGCELCVQQVVLLLHRLQARLGCLHLCLPLCLLPCKGRLCLILQVHNVYKPNRKAIVNASEVK